MTDISPFPKIFPVWMGWRPDAVTAETLFRLKLHPYVNLNGLDEQWL